MLFLSPLLALVSLIIVPALLVVSYRMRWRVFPATWDGQQREGDVAQIVDEDVNGVRVVKAFGQERRELERVDGCGRDAVRLADARGAAAVALPAAAAGDPVARPGRDPRARRLAGAAAARSPSAPSSPSPPTSAQLVAPARQLAGVLTIGQQARAGVERIFQLLDLPARRSPTRRTRSSCRPAAARSTFADVRLRLRRRRRRAATASTCGSPPASGSRSSGRAAAASRRRRCSCRASTTRTAAPCPVDGHDVRDAHAALAAPPGRRRLRGELPVLRLGARQHRLRPPGRDRRGDRGGRARRRRRTSSSRRCRAATTRSSASAG